MPRQVSILLCLDVFGFRACLGHNYSTEEMLQFKRGEDVLEEVEKFCYMSDMISYGGASKAMNARIGSAWMFSELSGVLIGKEGLSLKQRGKIY